MRSATAIRSHADRWFASGAVLAGMVWIGRGAVGFSTGCVLQGGVRSAAAIRWYADRWFASWAVLAGMVWILCGAVGFSTGCGLRSGCVRLQRSARMRIAGSPRGRCSRGW
ncbi:hypothetical protein C5D50_07160 [Rathayibacter sp. RFBD1]|nr:hypothetical protein C5D50_07160 [Rathayibacter sp. RFBD1]PPI58563.1 hypothetical protein C5D38_06740 [Rathayibacter sp. TRS19]